MQAFAALLDKLYFTYSNNEKLALLQKYVAETPDPERGFSIAILAGVISFKFFKPSLLLDIVLEKIDQYLFARSYDYVGDLSETVALLWPEEKKRSKLPDLNELINELSSRDKNQLKPYIVKLLNHSNTTERWMLIKLCTGNLRIGISQRFVKQALAKFGNKDIQELEKVWHAVEAPYLELFDWLEGKAPQPTIHDKIYFHPVMLSHPLDDKELLKIVPEDFVAEWKYDGIRVQIVSSELGKALFSRTGDDISHSFPDVLSQINFKGVFDGELVIKKSGKIQSFNELQQRLNRKKPSKALIESAPGHIILYDILLNEKHDLRLLPWHKRRGILESWYKKQRGEFISISPLIPFSTKEQLQQLRASVLQHENPVIEGLMFKKKVSLYVAGRPKGQWYKWKRDPHTVDAVLMYAQRGQGKRSSYYSDYTFGLWQNEQLLPIGKAYFGFTDEELYQLDKWIQNHTSNKFGPVREVDKELVFEVAFDSVHQSTRHKSGVALRFPRIKRIRWDKPAKEADELQTLKKLIRE